MVPGFLVNAGGRFLKRRLPHFTDVGCPCASEYPDPTRIIEEVVQENAVVARVVVEVFEDVVAFAV